ncbi:hypothetical protein JL193_08145 [Polaribacter batillariae]|uniref:Uncharacterized protein n=1 Tax=Polaribacter batillariae TaxID=2808900 RepID=A0ABX7SY77_9FLAO|nr:hypothetical protein [Polaribacter batillariae]QTD39197.1 hypothetical protein JL193_08145 [Polaribacter batillariae]
MAKNKKSEAALLEQWHVAIESSDLFIKFTLNNQETDRSSGRNEVASRKRVANTSQNYPLLLKIALNLLKK